MTTIGDTRYVLWDDFIVAAQLWPIPPAPPRRARTVKGLGRIVGDIFVEVCETQFTARRAYVNTHKEWHAFAAVFGMDAANHAMANSYDAMVNS